MLAVGVGLVLSFEVVVVQLEDSVEVVLSVHLFDANAWTAKHEIILCFTRGESILRFFVHAEEDDDSMDKDGNELHGECSRPQKHAKSPELDGEFFLDLPTSLLM